MSRVKHPRFIISQVRPIERYIPGTLPRITSTYTAEEEQVLLKSIERRDWFIVGTAITGYPGFNSVIGVWVDPLTERHFLASVSSGAGRLAIPEGVPVPVTPAAPARTASVRAAHKEPESTPMRYTDIAASPVRSTGEDTPAAQPGRSKTTLGDWLRQREDAAS